MTIIPKTIEFTNEEQNTLVKALEILAQLEKSIKEIKCFSGEYYKCSDIRQSLERFLCHLGIID